MAVKGFITLGPGEQSVAHLHHRRLHRPEQSDLELRHQKRTHRCKLKDVTSKLLP
jgi:hypothetical protein